MSADAKKECAGRGVHASPSHSTQSITSDEPSVQVLELIFNQLFSQSENTVLKSGAEEPLYSPADENGEYCEIRSTRDYFRSALHEISHWCIAGVERRKLVDFGYWYEPDGRSEAQQAAFEKVEVKPQALEWIFTEACATRFCLSGDNVNNPDAGVSNKFKHDVWQQTLEYWKHGLPERASIFLESLQKYFKTELNEETFRFERLK